MNENENPTPTTQDQELVEKYLDEFGGSLGPEPANFVAWLRANYFVDADHKSWF